MPLSVRTFSLFGINLPGVSTAGESAQLLFSCFSTAFSIAAQIPVHALRRQWRLHYRSLCTHPLLWSHRGSCAQPTTGQQPSRLLMGQERFKACSLPTAVACLPACLSACKQGEGIMLEVASQLLHHCKCLGADGACFITARRVMRVTVYE